MEPPTTLILILTCLLAFLLASTAESSSEEETSIARAPDPLPQPQVKDEGGHGALFIRIGSLANGLAYGHIGTTISFPSLERRINRFKNVTVWLESMIDLSPERGHEEHNPQSYIQLTHLRDWLNMQILETETKLKAVINSFEPSANNGRNRRQLAAGILGVVFGGIIGSVASGFGLKTLVSVAERKQDVLAAHIEEQDLQLYATMQEVNRLNATVEELIEGMKSYIDFRKSEDTRTQSMYAAWSATEDLRSLRETLDAVVVAHHGHLSDKLIQSSALQKAVNEIRENALKHGRELGISSYADAYGLPCSYLYMEATRSVHIITHLPMYALGLSLDLFRYVPTPIVFKPEDPEVDQDLPFLEVTAESAYIAISKDRTMYRTYTTESLEACLSLGTVYFCEDLSLFKIRRPDCLLGLLLNQISMIREQCVVTSHKKATRVARLNSTTYAIMSPVDDEMSINCQDKDTVSRYFRGTTLVNLDPGCTINTAEVKIHRNPFEPPIEVESVLVGRAFQLEDLAPDHSADKLENLFRLRESLGASGNAVPFTQLRGLNDFHAKWEQVGEAHTITLAVPLITITILAIGLLILCCIAQRKFRKMPFSTWADTFFLRPKHTVPPGIRHCCTQHEAEDIYGSFIETHTRACDETDTPILRKDRIPLRGIRSPPTVAPAPEYSDTDDAVSLQPNQVTFRRQLRPNLRRSKSILKDTNTLERPQSATGAASAPPPPMPPLSSGSISTYIENVGNAYAHTGAYSKPTAQLALMHSSQDPNNPA